MSFTDITVQIVNETTFSLHMGAHREYATLLEQPWTLCHREYATLLEQPWTLCHHLCL